MKIQDFDLLLKQQQELIIQIARALHEQDTVLIQALIAEWHPVDIAVALEEVLPEDMVKLPSLLNDEQLAAILEQASEELQLAMLSLLSNDRTIVLFSYMSADDVVDVLGTIPIDRRKTLIRQMKKSESQAIQELLGYAENSAGGIMTTEYIALSDQLSVGDALKKIKQIGPRTEVIETIFILNQNHQLIGTADLRDILVAADEATLQSITEDHIVSVHPDTDQEEVCLLVSKYDLTVIPVVSQRNALLGIITVDDIIDIMVNEYTEDMLQMGGTSKEERIDDSALESISKRLPWLLVNLLTAFLAAFTVSLFEDVIAQVVALAAAMPIVAGMGGNAGTQSLSIVIRSITLGEVRLKTCWPLLRKEVLVSVVNGAVTGILTGVILYLRYGNPYLGLIIFAAMVGNLIIAGFFGFLIPLIVKYLKADPALASSIFLTTATDVFGFFLFLGLAQLFLPLLL